MASPHSPFETIEGTQEYLALLDEVVDETRTEVLDEAAAIPQVQARRLDAFRLLAYKLGQLHEHIRASRRILNDLRTLRRVMLSEPAGHSSDAPPAVRPSAGGSEQIGPP